MSDVIRKMKSQTPFYSTVHWRGCSSSSPLDHILKVKETEKLGCDDVKQLKEKVQIFFKLVLLKGYEQIISYLL